MEGKRKKYNHTFSSHAQDIVLESSLVLTKQLTKSQKVISYIHVKNTVAPIILESSSLSLLPETVDVSHVFN